jgi:hypothetical protein
VTQRRCIPGAVLAGILVAFPIHWLALLIHSGFFTSSDSFITIDGKGLLEAIPLEMLERFGYALVVPGTVVGIGAWIAPRFHFVTAVVLTVLFGGVVTLAYLYLFAHVFERTYPAWRTVLMVMFWIISFSFALFRARGLDKAT